MSPENERYFPNHKIEPEIGLAEYNFACARVGSTDESITWATNITALISTAATFAALKTSEYKVELATAGTNEETLRLIVLCSILLFSFLSIVHLSYLHKSRIFASRKVIVLRRMLGVSYGENNLVLPNWRIEGADNPFAIKIFPGFFSYQSFPVHMVLLSALTSTFLLGPSAMIVVAAETSLPQLEGFRPIYFGFIWYLLGLSFFKWQLREVDENILLWLSLLIARLLNVEITTGLNTSIYGIKLDIAEAKRLHSDFACIDKVAVFLEDGEFFEHSGINWKGVGRAIYARMKKKFAGGGSSITQQFVRSNFIVRLSPTVRRKIVEMLLAKWIESVWSKRQILDGYLVTARYDRSVYGFHRAFRHFFSDSPKLIEPWEAFILVERLGNVRGQFRGKRVRELLRRAISSALISMDDVEKILKYYNSMLDRHFELPLDHPTPIEVLASLKQPQSEL